MNTGSRNFGYSSLIIATPFKSHVLFSNQGNVFEFTPTSRRLIFISAANIKAGVEIRRPQSHNLLYFSRALPSLTLYGLLPPK